MNARPAEAKAPGSEGGALRRCAVTRRVLDKSALIRFVRAPDGTVVPDVGQVLPGRGVWIGAERALVGAACRRKGALARAGRVSEDLSARCEAALAQRALTLLGLARRAGQLVIGAQAVRAALGGNEAQVLVQARDAAADGRGKIERLRAAAAPDCVSFVLFDRAELAAALGRDAVHLAIRRGGLAAKFVTAAGRLAGFRAVDAARERRAI